MTTLGAVSLTIPTGTAVPSTPRLPRLLVAASTGALLMWMVAGGFPAVSQVFPQPFAPHAPATATQPANSAATPPIDTSAVVEEATHTLAPVPGRPGTLQASDPSYHAVFDTSGFTYLPDGASAALGVSLSGIARGDHAFAVDRAGWQADGNVATRQVSPGMGERVTARDGQLEWDLVLAEPPAGTGDLTVTGRLDGVIGAPVHDGSGWRLGLAGGQSATLGETVVVDAHGTELYRALPVVADGTVQMVIPNRVLHDAAYPLTVDPTVGNPVTVASTHNDGAPKVAFNGTNFLVVWQRSDGGNLVVAALVSGDGKSVGGAVEVSTTGRDFGPDVAWNGANFLVVWSQKYDGDDWDIDGRLVSPTGLPAPAVLAIATPLTHQEWPAVTAGGSTFYVVWHDNRSGNYDIYGGRVGGNGAILDGSGRAVATDAKNEFSPDVAWNGGTFLVTYQYAYSGTDNDIYAQLVTPAGATTGPRQPMSTTSANQKTPSVASDGKEWLVAWADHRNGNDDIYATRVNGFGVRVDTSGIQVSTFSSNDTSPRWPSTAPTSSLTALLLVAPAISTPTASPKTAPLSTTATTSPLATPTRWRPEAVAGPSSTGPPVTPSSCAWSRRSSGRRAPRQEVERLGHPPRGFSAPFGNEKSKNICTAATYTAPRGGWRAGRLASGGPG